jgi:hypothetical protein
MRLGRIFGELLNLNFDNIIPIFINPEDAKNTNPKYTKIKYLP